MRNNSIRKAAARPQVNASPHARLNLANLPELSLAKICDALDGPSRQAVAALGNRSLTAGLLQPGSHHVQSRLPGVLRDGLRQPQALVNRLKDARAASSLLQQALAAAPSLELAPPHVWPDAIVEGFRLEEWNKPMDYEKMYAARGAHAKAIRGVVAHTSGPLYGFFEQLWLISAASVVRSVRGHYEDLFQTILQRSPVVDLRISIVA